jgi:hypothetical protein
VGGCLNRGRDPCEPRREQRKTVVRTAQSLTPALRLQARFGAGPHAVAARRDWQDGHAKPEKRRGAGTVTRRTPRLTPRRPQSATKRGGSRHQNSARGHSETRLDRVCAVPNRFVASGRSCVGSLEPSRRRVASKKQHRSTIGAAAEAVHRRRALGDGGKAHTGRARARTARWRR